MLGLEILTTEEMYQADEWASRMGVPSLTLMENAGHGVALEAERMLPNKGRVVVLCGPGNNGGDGFVAARRLKEKNFDVSVCSLCPVEELKGDAKLMATRWEGSVGQMHPDLFSDCDLIIDGLFGAGLKRKIEGTSAQIINAINNSQKPVLSIDVPSGLDGSTGTYIGPVVKASCTVTFFRKKIGHLLLPGRILCGKVVVLDIGIPSSILEEASSHKNLKIKIDTFSNDPRLWKDCFPIPQLQDHKYSRGHVLVVSGDTCHTGAARLGASGALRIGAGLVTLASPSSAVLENASHLTSIMLTVSDSPTSLENLLQDKRKNSILIGPAVGVCQQTAEMVLIALRSGTHVVLDADALSVFSLQDLSVEQNRGLGFTSSPTKAITGPEILFSEIHQRKDRFVILTPHEGEFSRLFGSDQKSKLERARAAARKSGAIVLLKGADTVIAAPDGKAAINDNAPSWLATAGSGDVLSGFIVGLLAQKMPAFEAACAAVWLHGECANQFGVGLISEDLPKILPQVLAKVVK